MAKDHTEGDLAVRNAAQFVTTHWSVVLAAGDSASPDSRAALEELCRKYWFPLYAFVRRVGYSVEAAKDLTQGFFAQFLRRGALSQADHQRGRFRSYLLTCLNNYLRDERRRGNALKRGGDAVIVTVDSAEAEKRYSEDGVDAQTPDKVYERQWAMALLERVMGRLAEATDQDGMLNELKAHLVGEEGAVPYTVLAVKWRVSEGAIRMRVHRLRERYRDLLREEIADTVGSPPEIDEEIRHLMNVLGSA